MDARSATAYQSLLRIVQFVDRNEPLRALAAESTALTLLREHIEQFETLTQQQSVAAIGSLSLTAQRRAVRRMLWVRLDTIRRASDYARLADPTIPPFRPPDIDSHNMQFIGEARGIVSAIDRWIDSLVTCGLQRTVIDDIPPLADALEQLVSNRDAGASSRHAATSVLPIVIRSARKLVPLIYRQLEPAMTPELLVEWKQAASLGRTHRSKALRSGRVRRLPAGNRRPVTPEQWSIRGVVRHIMMWLVEPTEKTPSRNTPVTDYDVNEIKRLHAPDMKPTGTDGDRPTTS
jgi:hypothetical protein